MKRKLLFTLGCLVGLATLSYSIYAWYNAITYVSTDDAYVEGTISPVSAKVAGHVVELLVQDNQVVKKGDLLMRIDPRDFQAKREQARAAVATAEATLRAARTALIQQQYPAPISRTCAWGGTNGARCSAMTRQTTARAGSSGRWTA